MKPTHRKPLKPNISVPIDQQLDSCLRQDMAEEHISRADIVRKILRRHYGLIRQSLTEPRTP